MCVPSMNPSYSSGGRGLIPSLINQAVAKGGLRMNGIPGGAASQAGVIGPSPSYQSNSAQQPRKQAAGA